jgi:hypothetical protein
MRTAANRRRKRRLRTSRTKGRANPVPPVAARERPTLHRAGLRASSAILVLPPARGVATVMGERRSSFAEGLIDGATCRASDADAGSPRRAVRRARTVPMATGNMTVTPDEEMLAGGARHRYRGRQIPSIVARMCAAGRGDQLGAKHHGALASLSRVGTPLERSAGIAYRAGDCCRLVPGGAEPALELPEEIDARRRQGDRRCTPGRGIVRCADAGGSRGSVAPGVTRGQNKAAEQSQWGLNACDHESLGCELGASRCMAGATTRPKERASLGGSRSIGRPSRVLC